MPSLRDSGCFGGTIQTKIGRVVLLFAMVLLPEMPRYLFRLKEPSERRPSPEANKILAEARPRAGGDGCDNICGARSR